MSNNGDHFDGALHLRLATQDDAEMILGWQQEPGNRSYSRNAAAPTLGEHMAWIAAVLVDSRRRLYVIERESVPVGVLRVDETGDGRAEISILVGASHQGKGIGTGALRLVRCLEPELTLLAEIHSDNVASCKCFSAAGYILKGQYYESAPPAMGEDR